MIFFSPYDFLLIPGIILAIYAQSKVKGTYERYRKVRSARGVSGAQVAQEILRMNNIYDVNVEETSGVLSDHYDPRSKTLRLSSDIYHSSSIAALGIAAHEAGHAAQHAKNYMPLKVRHSIFPIASIGSNLAMPFFLIGFIFSTGGLQVMMDIGILLFTGAVLFQLVTLPVEFNASKRALLQLESGGFLRADEVNSARKVLSAAALTYVAATAAALLTLLRLILLRGARD